MAKSKVVIMVQARTGSTRMPGKIMRPVLGKEVLVHQLERLRRARTADQVVVVTTHTRRDLRISALCYRHQIPCFAGDENDLLDRHYQAARHFNADVIVKIPSDCPLIDPQIADRVIGHYLDHEDEFDFVSNLHPATYPDGNDVEVMPFDILEIAWREAKKNFEREHTTPFVWEQPQRFRLANIAWETGLDFSTTHRWTLDYEQDFAFIRSVYENLYQKNPHFGMNDILQLLAEQPELCEINSRFAGKYWYENHLDELTQIDDYKSKMEPRNNGED